jgi:ribosome-binding ATPase YchF (GTP1/OBG family)
MKNFILNEEQLKNILEFTTLSDNTHEKGSYMAKQQLYTIATLTYKMWEMMEDEEQLEDWMESKIAQTESSIIAVVKNFMYKENKKDLKGMDTLDFDDLIIGK